MAFYFYYAFYFAFCFYVHTWDWYLIFFFCVILVILNVKWFYFILLCILLLCPSMRLFNFLFLCDSCDIKCKMIYINILFLLNIVFIFIMHFASMYLIMHFASILLCILLLCPYMRLIFNFLFLCDSCDIKCKMIYISILFLLNKYCF